MRNLLRAFGCLIVIIICSLAIFNMYLSDATRENVERSVTRSIDQSIQEVRIKQMYKYANEQEMQADFIKCFAESDDTVGSVQIKFYQTDITQGFMDVEITKTFPYPSSQTGTITVRKAVLTEEYPRNQEVI